MAQMHSHFCQANGYSFAPEIGGSLAKMSIKKDRPEGRLEFSDIGLA